MGAGKSAVARILAEQGGRVIDADQLAREVTAPGSAGLARIAEEFGPGAIDAGGALDRRWMADLVFSDAAARDRLNAIVHPLVQERTLELLALYESQGAGLVALDVPLLFEAGLETLVDCVVTVTVPLEALHARLGAARGMSRSEVDRRLAAQASQEEKARRADYVLSNTGSLDQLRSATLDVLRRIQAEKGPSRPLPKPS